MQNLCITHLNHLSRGDGILFLVIVLGRSRLTRCWCRVEELCISEGRVENIARALVSMAAFLDLAPPDSVDPDDAVRALEQLSHDLRCATAEEQAALSNAGLALAQEAEAAGAQFDVAASFYRSFLSVVGLDIPATEDMQ